MARTISRKISFYILIIILFAGILVLKMPLSGLNLLLNDAIYLHTEGNFHKGLIQGITINQKNYPLSCQLNRKNILNYHIKCNAPLDINANIDLSLNEIKVNKITVTGELAKAKDWLTLINIPKGITGDIDLVIKDSIIKDSIITRLDITNHTNSLYFFNHLILENINIKTTSPTTPISFDTSSEGSHNLADLFLTTNIDNNHYKTTGTIKGDNLSKYHLILNYFGQRKAKNEWYITLSGKLTP